MIVHSKAIIRSVMTSPFLTRLQVWLSSSPFLQRQQDRGREAMIWATCLFPSTWNANGSMHATRSPYPGIKSKTRLNAHRVHRNSTAPAEDEEGDAARSSLRQDAQPLLLVAAEAVLSV
jgi:hypothetical protein